MKPVFFTDQVAIGSIITIVFSKYPVEVPFHLGPKYQQ